MRQDYGVITFPRHMRTILHKKTAKCGAHGELHGGGDAIRAQIGPQNFRHGDRTIFLLIVFHERDPGASHSEP